MEEQEIFALVLFGLLSLIISAFTIQAVENDRQERLRKEAILRKRASSLQYMLDYFPSGFLGAELRVLVCKSLLNVYSRLSRLVVHSREYRSAALEIQARLYMEAQRQQIDYYQPLASHSVINEVKVMLGMLSKSIDLLQQEGSITHQQAVNYVQQIRMLVARATIDSYILNANQAEERESSSLALHYYRSALEQIGLRKLTDVYAGQIDTLEQQIQELEVMLAQKSVADESVDAQRDKDWDEYLEESDWQEKKYYDL